MRTMTVSEARAALPAVLDRVASGEEVTITRHGRPVAVVVRPDALRSRRADLVFAAAAELRMEIDEARTAPVPTEPVGSDRLVELVEALRDSRRAR